VPAAAPSEPALGVPSKEERFTALLVWGIDVLFQVLGPYLMWRLQAPDSAFVSHHARACVNHTLTVTVLLGAVCLAAGVLLWGLLAVPDPTTELGIDLYQIALYAILGLGGALVGALLLLTAVVHVVAFFKAWRGRWYVPPFCWRFVK